MSSAFGFMNGREIAGMIVRSMRSRMIHLLFFAFGLAAFVFLINRFGLENIADTARSAGWSLVYVVIVWLVIYLLNTLAWRLVLGRAGSSISFSLLFTTFVSGYALNTITPFLAVGGEPYRARILADAIDAPSSVSAVVLYRMINLLGHLLLLMTGVLLGILMLPMSAAFRIPLIFIFMAVGGLGYWIFTVHRDGMFVRSVRWTGRFRILRRVTSALNKHAAHITRMDALFTDAYHHRRNIFVVAVLLEYVTRAMMGLEVYIILQGAGTDVSFGSALFLYVTYSIIINLVFFIPLNFGIRESGLILGLQGLAMTPLLGVYLGVVIRLRELFWILVGLGFMLAAAMKQSVATKEVQES
jgi:uncharacterized protein (TIRG00374 family)